MSDLAVRTEGLRKRYGGTVALHGLDLEIDPGGMTGLVGPNGAGKTTLVEILEGLRAPTSGRASVLGLHPRRDGAELRERIGVQLQSTAFPGGLRVAETLALFASLYRRARAVESVLEQVGLAELGDRFTDSLSGGERQRLALATALVHDPDLLLLDEPTAGLDPEARRRLHDDLEALRDEGRTVLLTTHYTPEVEKLCDRVLVLRDGEIVADGSPPELVRDLGGGTVVRLAADGPVDRAALASAGLEPDGRSGEYLRFTAPNVVTALDALRPLLAGDEPSVTDLRLAQPTLEDVYLELVGSDPSRADAGDRRPRPGPGGA